MAELRIRGKVTNAHEAAGRTRFASGSLERMTKQRVSDMAKLSVEMLQLVAPTGRTKALQRGISARRRGEKSFDISVSAIAPESGYNYAPVTRFGHRVRWIRPPDYPRGALRVHWQAGGINFFAAVRGVGQSKPHRDWTEDAWPSIKAMVDEEARQLSADIGTRLFT